MKKQDLAAAGKRKLQEFRKKKDKSAPSAASTAELEHEVLEEDARPDPNIWRRALENEVNTLRTETGRLQAELVREQKEKASLQLQVVEVQTSASSMKSQLARVEREIQKSEDLVSVLRKNIETITGERNAAIAAKEDLGAQLRVARRRLQEAEEEQYRAEEDTAALRAEVARLEALSHGHGRRPSQEVPMAENELEQARAELQMMLTELQSSQQSVAMERQRHAALAAQVTQVVAEKDEAGALLARTRQKLQSLRQQLDASQARAAAAEQAAAVATVAALDTRGEAEAQGEGGAPATPEPLRSVSSEAERAELEAAAARLADERRRLEGQCKELAWMVERQEQGRQKLLAEVDSQSLEIERLFGENAGLHAGLNEYTAIATSWEEQVHEALAQNQELRAALRRLREEQRIVEDAHSTAMEAAQQQRPREEVATADEGEEARAKEAQSKKALTQALARGEALAEQCAQLSAENNQLTQAMTKLSRAYQPLLIGIESRLLQMRQEAV